MAVNGLEVKMQPNIFYKSGNDKMEYPFITSEPSPHGIYKVNY